MADDGGWTRGQSNVRTRAALEQLRAMLDAMEVRLAGPLAPLPAETTAELIGTLDELSRRLAVLEDAAGARCADLSAAVARLSGKLEARTAARAAHQQAMAVRLDLMLGALARSREVEAAEPPREEPKAIRMVLAAASAAAVLSVAGAALLIGARPELLPRVVAVVLDELPRPVPEKPRTPVRTVSPAGAPLIDATPTPADRYEAVAEALAHGEALALGRLTGLAQAGDARAQLHLASLYETGGAGLPRDLAAARAWTHRAAERGDRMAMHNLGLFLIEGEGGPRDPSAAVGWFRRAAARGVVDSQYNLGLLYEAGEGVARNLREAYRWYSIAANAGDVASREKQVEIEARLTPGERASLDREVRNFEPGAAPTSDGGHVIAPATTVAETQALLARRGYYVGPLDGVVSPAFRAAAAAYLRDHPPGR